MPQRFIYEEAERELDRFAASISSRAFTRAYRKLKFFLRVYAFIDYGSRKEMSEPEQARAMSYAWEDLQMAFTGHGEWTLQGCVLHLWSLLGTREEEKFYRAIKQGFEAAEEATPAEAVRRYLHKYRTKPPRKPSQDWNLATILPMSGKVLEEWALDEGEDPAEVLEQWHWLEVADRAETKGYDPYTGEQGKTDLRQAKRAHLRLVTKEEE